MDISVIPIESVRERDIDLLLIEEFCSSEEFINFFLKENKLPSCNNFIGAWRSITEFGLGETDILVEYISNKNRIGLMIENKLDASFQPQQEERYKKREAEYINRNRFNEVHTILVAPKSYIDSQNKFSLTISYEVLEKYFDLQETPRAIFKKTLLQIACEKLRRGYTAVNSDIVLSFWQSYWRSVTTAVPVVTMKQPDIVPDGSDWIELTAYQGKLHIVHKLAQGSLDCTGLTEESEQVLNQLYPGAEYKDFKSGKVLRIPTAPLNRKIPLSDQGESLDVCLHDISVISNI